MHRLPLELRFHLFGDQHLLYFAYVEVRIVTGADLASPSLASPLINQPVVQGSI